MICFFTISSYLHKILIFDRYSIFEITWFYSKTHSNNIIIFYLVTFGHLSQISFVFNFTNDVNANRIFGSANHIDISWPSSTSFDVVYRIVFLLTEDSSFGIFVGELEYDNLLLFLFCLGKKNPTFYHLR